MSLATSKQVRISPETMEKLAKKRAGWESPDECINRVLSTDPCNPKKSSDDTEDTSDTGESQKDE